MSEDDTLTSELLKLIPGFSAYRDSSKYRDDDRAARAFLAQRLGDCAGSLDRFASEAVKLLKLELVEEIESIRSDVDRAKYRVQSAIEGYSSFWESTGAKPEAIKQALEIDHTLVSLADQIDQAAQACTKFPAQWDAGKFQDWTRQIHQRLDQRGRLLDADS